MAYFLSRKADDDFIAIYETGARLFGISQAERYHDLLEQAFQDLAENPMMARERLELRPPVRVHPCGSHVVIYTLEESGDIFIIRIRHAREDWMSDPQ